MSDTNNHPNRPTQEQLARHEMMRGIRRDALFAAARVCAGSGITPQQLTTDAQMLANWILRGEV